MLWCNCFCDLALRKYNWTENLKNKQKTQWLVIVLNFSVQYGNKQKKILELLYFNHST